MAGTNSVTILLTETALLPLMTEWIEKGHQVNVIDGPPFDLVIGPQAFRMTDEMIRTNPAMSIELAIKGARALKKATGTPLPKKATKKRVTTKKEPTNE